MDTTETMQASSIGSPKKFPINMQQSESCSWSIRNFSKQIPGLFAPASDSPFLDVFFFFSNKSLIWSETSLYKIRM